MHLPIFCLTLNFLCVIKKAADFSPGDCGFVPELTSFDNDGVASLLAVKVMGKSDKKPVVVCIWRDDDISELCLFRHLLAYVHLAGVKDGELLFPNLDKRESTISYSIFIDRFKKLFFKVTRRHGPWDTHSHSKNSVFISSLVWGGWPGTNGECSSQVAWRQPSLQKGRLYIARNNGYFITDFLIIPELSIGCTGTSWWIRNQHDWGQIFYFGKVWQNICPQYAV